MDRVFEYLQSIKKSNEALYFSLLRFYKSPEIIETVLSKKIFFMNNDFICFLFVCMLDEEFMFRLDIDTADMIKDYIDDCIAYKEDVLNNKKEKLGTVLSLFDINDKEYSKTKVKKFDHINAKTISDELEFHKNFTIITEKRYNQLNIMDTIIKDDYENNKSTFLYQYSFFMEDKNCYDTDIFEVLVCDNEFLEIIENLIILDKLKNKVIINNIISILDFGINMKLKNPEFFAYISYMEDDKIKKFDLKRAVFLRKRLLDLKNNLKKNFRLVIKNK